MKLRKNDQKTTICFEKKNGVRKTKRHKNNKKRRFHLKFNGEKRVQEQ